MKRSFLFAFAAILAATGMSSCEGGGNNKVGDVNFKRMHLDGVTALALASDGSSAKKARVAEENGDSLVYDMLEPVYSVSADGTLVEVTYTIEAKGEGEVVDMVKANMRLVMEYIYAIGDDWLWLYGCRYDYPGLEEQKEPYYSMLKKVVDNISRDFLVRKSDGALFLWKDGKPYLELPDGYHQQSDIYGVVESVKGEVYSNSRVSDNMLYRLKDEGDELAITKMHNNTLFATAIMPDNRGVLGMDIYFQNITTYIPTPGVLFPNSVSIAQMSSDNSISWLQDANEYYWYMVSVDNTLYAIANVYSSPTFTGTAFYTVELSESPTPTARVKDLVATMSDGIDISRINKVNKQPKMSWMQYGQKYTFDPQAKKITKTELPEHYPSDINRYYDDVAYVMRNDEQAFYICDLAKSAAEEVVIDYSALNSESSVVKSTIRSFGLYNPSTQTFTTTAYTIDGLLVTIMVDVAGENKGKARVYKSGDNTAGQVISVMVRLN